LTTSYFKKELKKLFPINRSITGKGFLDSIKILNSSSKIIKISKIASRKKVFDWRVPMVWNINDAYISYNGIRIVDFKKNNLHLVGYSKSVNKTLNFKNLKKKLITVKKIDYDAIPYATSYYKKDWGFCVSRKQFDKMSKFKRNFKVCIDSNFKKGNLFWGEALIKGQSKKTVIFSTYLCHPSMANNELSGPLVCNQLIKFLIKRKNYYSYRILFLPETIGAISYLAKNFNFLKKNLLCGFVISCVGDKGRFSKINSKYNSNFADKILNETFRSKKIKFNEYSYLDRGSDERQFCSPLINLPFCTITRSKFETYKEYHTSKDDINFVSTKSLNQSVNFLKNLIKKIELSIIPISNIKCEPMLSKRNLYPSNRACSKQSYVKKSKEILDFFSYCDGTNNLNQLSKITKLTIHKTKKIFCILKENKIIKVY